MCSVSSAHAGSFSYVSMVMKLVLSSLGAGAVLFGPSSHENFEFLLHIRPQMFCYSYRNTDQNICVEI